MTIKMVPWDKVLCGVTSGGRIFKNLFPDPLSPGEIPVGGGQHGIWGTFIGEEHGMRRQ